LSITENAEREDTQAYAALADNVELHRTGEGGSIVLRDRAVEGRRSTRPGAEFAGDEHFVIDGYIVDYLSLLDGTRDEDEVAATFADSYGPLFGTIYGERALRWAKRNARIVERFEEPLGSRRAPRVTGSADTFYPMHATFEIIETCNFACDHCYYSSSPSKTGRISKDDAIAVMDRLRANGTRIIELTGGECTIHPDFPEILEHASQTFDLVAIISNGYRIGTSDRIAEVVCSIPNVAVQISVDAMRERHDTFRKHRAAFDAAVTAIERLVAAGVPVRMASSISAENLDQVEELYQLGKTLGASRHSFAPVAPIGRGCNVSDTSSGSQEVAAQIDAILAPHQSDPSLHNYAELPDAAESYEPPRNCGAGWRTFTVDYNAEVRACNYSRDSKKFGNLLEEEYSDVFGQQASFYFHNAPSPGGRDCVGCDYYTHCRGCFVKAFLVSETEYPECPWRAHWFPDMPLSRDAEGAAATTPGQKRANTPVYSGLDSPIVCTSCSDTPAASPRPATGRAEPRGPEPVFISSSIGLRDQ
jgi:radical SAM protein with 4Fe4S-binding SPASM domain